MKRWSFIILTMVLFFAMPMAAGAAEYEVDPSPDDAYDQEYNDSTSSSIEESEETSEDVDQPYIDGNSSSSSGSSTTTSTTYTSPKTGDTADVMISVAALILVISGGVVWFSGKELTRA